MKNSDIYIFIPVTNSYKNGLGIAKNKKLADVIRALNLNKDDEMEKYIEAMERTIKDECKQEDYSDITRIQLGQIEFKYYSDDCLDDNDPKNKYIKCSLVLTWHKNSELGVLQIIFKKCEDIDAQIGGTVFTYKINFRAGNKEYNLKKLLSELDLKECGNRKIVYCNDRKFKDDDSINYLLAGESSIRIGSPFGISTSSKETLKKINYAKFDFYDLYASELAMVYLYDNYSNDYADGLQWETLLIYICEVAVFQNAAISRINKSITKRLQENGDINLISLKRIQRRYGKTIVFWDNNIFNYTLSQELSNDIIHVFGNEKLLDEYKKNDKHLQRIMDIKDSINNKEEGIVLNALTIILGTKELFDLVINFNDLISGHVNTVKVFGSGIVLLCLLTILVRRRTDKA